MMKNILKWIGTITLILVAASSSGTRLTQKHIDEEFIGKPVSNVLIIAFSRLRVKSGPAFCFPPK